MVVTTSEKVLAGTCIFVLLLAVGTGYEVLRAHEALAVAETKSAALKDSLAKSAAVQSDAQKVIAQQVADKAQITADFNRRMDQIQAQRVVVVTPQQAAAVANTLPGLPQPVQVQTVPATATTSAAQQLVIPASDIPAFQAYKLNCDAASAKLDECSAKSTADAIIAAQQQIKLDAVTTDFTDMKKDRDNWKTTAKGGTVWQRIKHDTRIVVVVGGIAYAAGRYGK